MKAIKLTNTNGKVIGEYVMVHERIKHFREKWADSGQILTKMISNENGVCLFKAWIKIEDKVVATGHAYEKEDSTFINRTNYIENAETSAVGRALAMFGIGIDASIASADEMQKTLSQEEESKPQVFITGSKYDLIMDEVEKKNISMKDFFNHVKATYDIHTLREMPLDYFKDILKWIGEQ